MGDDGLTRRERDIMGAVIMGETAREIGKAFGISERTVEIHRANVIAKLGAKNMIQAAVLFDRGTVSRETTTMTNPRQPVSPTEQAVLDRLQEDRAAGSGATWLRLVDEALMKAKLALVTSRADSKRPHLIAAAARLILAAELLGVGSNGVPF